MILKKAKTMVSKTPVKKTIETPKVETPTPENTSAPQKALDQTLYIMRVTL